MTILNILNNEYFNIFFSVILGIGIVALFRPICTGKECLDIKAPQTNDFKGYVFKFGKKCYEFDTEITECPPSGAIEAFREIDKPLKFTNNGFTRRGTPIVRCE